MSSYLVVFIGGGVGAACRHGVNRAAVAYIGLDFPVGTLLVNVLGGLLMGMCAEWLLAEAAFDEQLKLFLTTGVLGGFTTFSAFTLEAGLMWQRGDYATAAAYGLASVILSVVAVYVGMAATRAMT